MSIFLGNSEPSKIFVGGSEVASVRAGDTKVRPNLPTYETVTDSTNAVFQDFGATNDWYYGIAFTALKTGRIIKATFIYNAATSGILKIAKGDYASVPGTEYSYTSSPSGEYTLTTPFDIIEGNRYVASIKTGAASTYGFQYGGNYPITGTAIRYDYSTFSYDNGIYYQYIMAIKSLTIEYIP